VRDVALFVGLSKDDGVSREAGCCRAMSVRKGSPKPVMKSWTCSGSVREVSRQDRAMNYLA
jgi:hypothetical protein